MDIETKSLVLKHARADMAERVSEYYIKNARFLEDFEPLREPGFYTVETQKGLLEADEENRRAGTGYRFYIYHRDEPEWIIGSIAVSNIVRGCFLSGFLGYKLDREHGGRGYMTQAVNAVVDFAFNGLKLHRLEANVMPRNTASMRVLEKCGFEREGRARKYLKIHGVWEDHIHMVRLNDGV